MRRPPFEPEPITDEVQIDLETSDPGRRLAVVDPMYRIPEWAQQHEMGEQTTSAGILASVLRIVPVGDELTLMSPRLPETDSDALAAFRQVIQIMQIQREIRGLRINTHPQYRDLVAGMSMAGFHEVVDDKARNTLYLRTGDQRPYACASFIIGQAQQA
jgi:hypothetical protein